VEKEDELRAALRIAAYALILTVDDWGVEDIQIYPPEGCKLTAENENELYGWCSVAQLANMLLKVAAKLPPDYANITPVDEWDKWEGLWNDYKQAVKSKPQI